jgi:hypothetical protein
MLDESDPDSRLPRPGGREPRQTLPAAQLCIIRQPAAWLLRAARKEAVRLPQTIRNPAGKPPGKDRV